MRRPEYQRPRAVTIWCQAGPFDGYRAMTTDEPPDVFWLQADSAGRVARWASEVQGATRYERQRSVEQFDHERIYYPA